MRLTLRVLHIHSFDKGGGAETVFNITRKNKYNLVNYSGFIKTDISSTDPPDIKFRIYHSYPKFLRLVNYIFSFHNYFALKSFLSKNEIDVVHLHGFIGALSPSILLALKKMKRKKRFSVIQTMHDFHLVCPNSILFDFSSNEKCEACLTHKIRYPIFLKKCDRRGKVYTILKGLRSFIANNLLGHYNLIDKIIVPSDFVREKLVKANISAQKITIIRHPIMANDTDLMFNKENIICYFGRFSKEKNLMFLVSAFNEWKRKNKNDFRLLLVGEGDTEKELKEFSANCECKNVVLFKPFLPMNLLKEEIKRVKYYALSSNCYETAGMGILESLAFDIISIVPDIGGAKELVEKMIKIGGTYKEHDIKSWCETMDLLERNYEELFSRLKERKKNIIKEFGEEEYLKKINKLYRKIKIVNEDNI